MKKLYVISFLFSCCSLYIICSDAPPPQLQINTDNSELRHYATSPCIIRTARTVSLETVYSELPAGSPTHKTTRAEHDKENISEPITWYNSLYSCAKAFCSFFTSSSSDKK